MALAAQEPKQEQEQELTSPQQLTELQELQVSVKLSLLRYTKNNFLDKNSKEAFIKKLQICMKHYDYKDETKDVRGKVIFMFKNTFFRLKD